MVEICAEDVKREYICQWEVWERVPYWINKMATTPKKYKSISLGNTPPYSMLIRLGFMLMGPRCKG